MCQSWSPSGSPITIDETVTVSGFLGPPQGGVPVTLSYTKSDAPTLTRTVTTNFAGSFSDSFAPDQVGSWSIKASWAWDARYEDTESDIVTVVVEQPETSITVAESILTRSRMGVSTVMVVLTSVSFAAYAYARDTAKQNP